MSEESGNSIIFHTSSGYFLISNGFFRKEADAIKGYSKYKIHKEGCLIIEVKADILNTVIKLSDNDLLTFNVDTTGLILDTWASYKNDEKFLGWYNNELKALTNEEFYF